MDFLYLLLVTIFCLLDCIVIKKISERVKNLEEEIKSLKNGE